MTAQEQAQTRLRGLARLLAVVGVVGLALCAAGWVLRPAEFYRGYLIGFALWSSAALGCLGLLMLHHLVGGHWGWAIRRPLESGLATLPMVAVLFVPVVIGIRTLYPWTDHEFVSAHHHLEAKQLYLNIPFFIGRAAFYFLVWLLLAGLVHRWSVQQDREVDPYRMPVTGRLSRLSAGGMVAFFLTGTFAAFDWMMSLEPLWYSTMYGAYVVAGHGLTAMAVVILISHWLHVSGAVPLPRNVRQDLGSLLFMLIVFYSYLAFSQFLIIWSGNLPEETPWYAARNHGVWLWALLVMIAVHFVLPFFLLMSRVVKASPTVLSAVAGAVLLMRVVDWLWLVAPSYPQVSGWTVLMVVAAAAGIGGLWLAVAAWQLGSRSLTPAPALLGEEH